MALRSNLPSPIDRLTLAPGLEVSPLCLGAVGSPRVVVAAGTYIFPNSFHDSADGC